MTKEYHDPDVLDRLYNIEGLSTYDLADRFGVTRKTIRYWMDKNGIERREGNEAKPPQFFTHRSGYEKWQGFCLGTHFSVRVHRLLAVSEFGFDAVVGMDVHHRNGIPWDNRPENIELMSREEHISYHKPWEHSTA